MVVFTLFLKKNPSLKKLSRLEVIVIYCLTLFELCDKVVLQDTEYYKEFRTCLKN